MKHQYHGLKTTIRRAGTTYEVELEDVEGDGRLQCWVSKGNLTNSLSLLEDQGRFDDDPDDDAEIGEDVLEAIEKWASEHGY